MGGDWIVPEFVQTFQGVRTQQGTDAKFEAVLRANPTPQVRWVRHGQPLESSSKYELTFDPSSGLTSLKIEMIGPGDEGEYTCVAENPYGEVSAQLSIAPEFMCGSNMCGGGGRHQRALSPNCARMQLYQQSLQRKKERQGL